MEVLYFFFSFQSSIKLLQKSFCNSFFPLQFLFYFCAVLTIGAKELGNFTVIFGQIYRYISIFPHKEILINFGGFTTLIPLVYIYLFFLVYTSKADDKAH